MTRSTAATGDLRIRRTRKLIQEALIDLTIQKGFAAVTVRDITEYAGVNRATFYRHYQDKFDLLEQYAEEVYQLLDLPPETALPAARKGGLREKPALGLARMLEHVRAHAKFYRVMLSKNGDPAFADKIRNYVEKRIRRSLPDSLQQGQASTDLYLSYMSSGSVGAIRWWLEHDMVYTPAELAELASRFAAADLDAVLGHTKRTRAEG